MKHSLILAVLAAGPVAAQVEYTGSACSGFSGTTVGLTVEGPLLQGAQVELRVTGLAETPGFLLGGASLLPEPLSLTSTQFFGCTLYVSPAVFIPITLDASGAATVPVVMWAGGITAHVQAMIFDGGTEITETLGGLSRAASIQSLGAAGTLLITEVMKDPNFVSDTTGEWFEVHNPTAEDIDLEGWTLRDAGADTTVLAGSAGSILVPAGGYVTLGNGTGTLETGGVVHAAVYTDFVLENGADEIVLEDAEGVLIASLAFDDGLQWPDAVGASMGLDALYLHPTYMEDPEFWSVSDCELGGVPYSDDAATPGIANDQCNTVRPPTPTGELIFTEVMQNPKAVFDEVGEWFELFNTTGSAIDMQGYTIVLGNAEVVSSSVVVPAGGFALFAKVGSPASNGGLPTPDYVWATGLFLGNGSELLQVYDANQGLVCEVRYDNGGAFPDPNGASMSLDPGAFDIESSQIGTNWCNGQTPYGAGDLGTPRAANDACP